MQLIFIHGSGGCKESWQYQTEQFKGSDAINLPGHPDGKLCPTIEANVAWLRAYIQDKGYTDVVLAGHSLGGGIALQYALDFPEDLAGIIAVGSGGRLRVHPSFLEMLEKAVADPSLLENEGLTSFDLIEPGLAAVMKKRATENTPASFLNDMKACDQFDVMDRLQTITMPVLAIVGDQDTMTPPKYASFMVDKIAGAKMVIIPGGTHMAYAEKPVAVNQAIDAFLKSL
ncbi:MAG: alpha/beta hydrolase [Deltaproteobacteria bacterium]|jgi:pimeloyl-ACP methyl ester carboxylesterase|nr:alpha/beta hydrolase [Deltaproteobacteria bacterium]MBT4641131.1 alpha/beta hydrolase [Deltaproteobacteria bacterium]MBT6504987.1 alpha/beta hydrolase [Deltaproteobacteria bacterium]MBT7155079.1 alpha/beta hydrolase [Deltaproteobacteria bacterium]MBT7712149.1 alpha/beta hydrolase [Deltaproteobacteria bacterium]